ncbi:MAG: polyphosphate kinase 1 [Bdellovibrionota bacterium]|nr:polyphosphate kinase 1 [Bdellovibrionota bacterium]
MVAKKTTRRRPNIKRAATKKDSKKKEINPEHYISRDISWLHFNERVLSEALDQRTPLLERLKFCDIFISNLDEFFIQRIGRLKSQVDSGYKMKTLDGVIPSEQLTRIREMILRQNKTLAKGLNEIIFPELSKEGIHFAKWNGLGEKNKEFISQHFQTSILPILTPLAVDYGHPFPFISNLSKSLGISLLKPSSGEKIFSRVKIPDEIPQWVTVEEGKEGITFIHLEEILLNNLNLLFPGTEILDKMIFRVTRNIDLEEEDEWAEDLKEVIEEGLREKKFSPVIRLEVEKDSNEWISNYISTELELSPDDIYEMGQIVHYTSFGEITKIDRPKLKYKSWTPRIHSDFVDEKSNIFNKIKGKDIIVHHPYESFNSSVERFIETAAYDSKVYAIKITLYRTTINSKIIDSLIYAAQNGKQVACLVELKARFEEEKNIRLSEKLENEGIHVIGGMVGLKTHTKMCMVVRQDSDRVTTYVHLGTGNYNPLTSKLYSDLSFFTCRQEVGEEVVQAFNYLTGLSLKKDYKNIMIAPITMKRQFCELIYEEIKNKKRGKEGLIIAKMNAIEDVDIIEALYMASINGVKIKLIVRGFCCLRPGVPGLSENIEVISIIGRFLEHSRIYYFSGGQTDPSKGKFFIGSPDWMHRNLNVRVEVAVPLVTEESKSVAWKILNVNLNDKRSSWKMNQDGSYTQKVPEGEKEKLGSHAVLMSDSEENNFS